MNFDGPYTTYVLAAYGISALFIFGMAWHSWSHWRQAQKAWSQSKKTESNNT